MKTKPKKKTKPKATAGPPVTAETVSYLPGIDVSHHQAIIDWAAVAKAGYAYTYIKASEGNGGDNAFIRNWAGAKEAGVLRGAYHFFKPKISAVAQAKNFCDRVGALGALDLPPAIDVEETSQKHDDWTEIPKAADRVAMIARWIEEVTRILGRKPIIYTRANFWDPMMAKYAGFSDRPLWIAYYRRRPVAEIPVGWSKWTIWQYTVGRAALVPGIKTAIDMNRFAGTIDDLKRLATDSMTDQSSAA